MKQAVLFTAMDRVPYLQETLMYWRQVRGLDRFDFLFSIDPGHFTQQVEDEVRIFIRDTGIKKARIRINPERFGVLHHPWVGFQSLFSEGYDFVFRTEDDVIVSRDILEYVEWGSETYAEFSDDVATINAYSEDDGPEDQVVCSAQFKPLGWGTWKGRWDSLIGPTWDHDYSTFNGSPGNQAGWDWNLDTRVLPANNLHSIRPLSTRTDHIGVWGVHARPENYYRAPGFKADRPRMKYTEVYR